MGPWLTSSFYSTKKAIRIICNSKNRCHCDPLFIKLGLLKLNDIFNLRQAKFFFNLINNNLPTYFQCFRPKLVSHNYTTRHSHIYQLPKFRHEYLKKTLHYSIVKLINGLPNVLIKKIVTHSLPSFSFSIKTYILLIHTRRYAPWAIAMSAAIIDSWRINFIDR